MSHETLDILHSAIHVTREMREDVKASWREARRTGRDTKPYYKQFLRLSGIIHKGDYIKKRR